MITEDFVSFGTAKLLKEKGFDVPLNYYYNSDGRSGYATTYNWNQTIGDFPDYSRPTLQMAMKWLREEKEVFITIGLCDYPALQKSEWIPEISTHDSVFPEPSDIAYDTYEEACEAAIRYCLENLI